MKALLVDVALVVGLAAFLCLTGCEMRQQVCGVVVESICAGSGACRVRLDTGKRVTVNDLVISDDVICYPEGYSYGGRLAR